MSGEKKLYFGGVPVAPDVNLLMRELPIPAPGGDTPHDVIEKLLGLSRSDGRYKTVTDAWGRRLQEEYNLVIQRTIDGFHALTAVERLDYAEHQVTKGARRFVRATEVAGTTPVADLPDRELPRQSHLTRLAVMLVKTTKDLRRTYGLALKSPPESLPRPKPPE